MPFMLGAHVWLCLNACAVLFLYKLIRRHFKKRTFPPGPPGLPLLGNIFEVNPQGGWYKFTEYKNLYGDLLFFHGLGNHVLVLNSLKPINDLLEKRANIYSDRPKFTVVGELMGLQQCAALLPYCDEWRAQRKLAHYALSPRAVKQYYTRQEDLAALLAKSLLESPQDLFDHVKLTASRLILAIAYGLSVEKAEDEYISHADAVMDMVNRSTVPGAFLADLIPILKYLPSWVPFQREARKGKAMIEHMITRPFLHVKDEMEKGIAPPSLTQDLLSLPLASTPAHEHSVKWSTGTLYAAAGQTNVATVLTCLLAMALHPDKLARVQQELDAVVGTDRFPTIGDREHLPYLCAVIKETMRWHPILPLSIARATADDDVYEGYFIPKGTVVMPNIWAIALEPHGPYSPHHFVPERFLLTDEADMTPDPATYMFGFAKRACPGRHLAENSIFIMLATILANFDVAAPKEGLSARFNKGLISYPEPFDCVLTPRSASRAAQVLERASQCNV